MSVYLPRIMVLSFHCYQYQYYFEEEKTGDPAHVLCYSNHEIHV